MDLKTVLVSTALGLPLLRGAASAEPAYGDELAFLKKHVDVIELSDRSGRARLALVPAYQGRIMTSSAAGLAGASFGWINRELIASGEHRPHINVFGGEERFWLGPEGGPFALFFAHDAPEQTLAHWQTPPLFDTEPWQVGAHSRSQAAFSATGRLTNRAGTVLTFAIARRVRVLEADEAARDLGLALPAGAAWVGYESGNRLTNAGRVAWTKATGLPSIWLLGQFKSGPRTTIVVPIAAGGEAALGRAVRSDYFGPIPGDRLKVAPAAVFFRADGRARGKIGVPGRRAKPVVGSWDAGQGMLTLVEFNLPADAAARPYVDSRWGQAEDPFAGDVINAYNDGPPAPGVPPLGAFYELETSSPAAELAPGAALEHVSRTFHFTGDRAALDGIARAQLGVSLDAIEGAFP